MYYKPGALVPSRSARSALKPLAKGTDAGLRAHKSGIIKEGMAYSLIGFE
jgi:hypothetical protein